jgi:hypothetical protein
MIVSLTENKALRLWKESLNEPYLAVNTGLAVVLGLVMIYSLVFSPDREAYPIVCIHEKLTGEQCVSCGLSHSFSLILRGRLHEAYEWNPLGMRVFMFFASQLVLRIVFSGFYLRFQSTRKELIAFDIGGSVLLFLLTFMPFMIWIFRFS